MIDLGAAEASARRTAAIGSGLALGGAAAYGVNIVFARVCANLGLTGADLIAYRSFILVPALIAFLLAARKAPFVDHPQRPIVGRFAVSAAATALFYLTSLQYLPVALAVTIFYTYPLIVMLLTPFIDGLRLPARRWLAAGVAFAGVIVAVGPAHATLDWRGVLFACLGSLSCASMFINGSRLSTEPMTTFFWCQLFVAPVAVAFALTGGGLSSPSAMAAAFWPFAIMAGCYVLGFLMQIGAGMRISAATASLLFLLEPIAAIAGAALFIGETLTTLQIIGVALVVGALAFDLWPMARRGPEPPR